jgi:hypothetical protein
VCEQARDTDTHCASSYISNGHQPGTFATNTLLLLLCGDCGIQQA